MRPFPRAFAAVICSLLLGSPLLAACSGEGAAPCADGPLTYGFYASFPPVSESANPDPDSPNFNAQIGYEGDLLTALEAMEGAGVRFERHGIAVWEGIWLRAATPDYDVVGGGITILDSRRRDASGAEVVTFTTGHIAFPMTLLARAADASRYDGFDSVTSADRIGAERSTTGEGRTLRLTGLTDREGVLVAGVRVETPAGLVETDGSDRYVITSGGASTRFEGRTRLLPPSPHLPELVYVAGEPGLPGEAQLIEMLIAGEVDLVAMTEMSSIEAVNQAGGSFAVVAREPETPYGGLALALEDAELARCLSDKLDYLTDDRRIGYADWVEDPSVFLRRAEQWNEER